MYIYRFGFYINSELGLFLFAKSYASIYNFVRELNR